MQWALVDADGVIVNLIVYDGVSDYAPEGGLTLQEVSLEKQIGDLAD